MKSGTFTADTVYSVMLLRSCQQTCVCVESVEVTDTDKLIQICMTLKEYTCNIR